MDLSFSDTPRDVIHLHCASAGQAQEGGTPCDSCSAHDLCPGSGIARHARMPPFGRRRLRRGQALFRTGDPFAFCWCVRSGTMKSSLPLADGREQVMGFHFPGELLGADAIASDRHPTTAVALEDCTLCAIPIYLSMDVPEAPALGSTIWAAIAMAALREREMTALLACSGAEQRVAAFLIDVAARLSERGWSPHEFHLRMSRAEIGSLLGVNLETVSRAFTALAQQGLIEVNRKHVRILHPDALQAHAQPAARGWMRQPPLHPASLAA